MLVIAYTMQFNYLWIINGIIMFVFYQNAIILTTKMIWGWHVNYLKIAKNNLEDLDHVDDTKYSISYEMTIIFKGPIISSTMFTLYDGFFQCKIIKFLKDNFLWEYIIKLNIQQHNSQWTLYNIQY